MDSERSSTPHDNTEEKEVQYYAALVNAYFNTKSELDKQLLMLSSLALGVLVAFMDNISDRLGLGMWIFASFSFLLSIAIVLTIFSQNALLLEQIINQESEKRTNKALLVKDIIAQVFFTLGMLFTVIFSLYSFDYTVLFPSV